jgi:hypothetical protein
MNFIKECFHLIKSTYSILKDYTYYLPLLYVNFIYINDNYILQQCKVLNYNKNIINEYVVIILNVMYSYDFYINNKVHINTYFKNISIIILHELIKYKIYLKKIYNKYYINNNFILEDAYIYINAYESINIKLEFKYDLKNINKIDDKIFLNILNKYNIQNTEYNDDIRLKLIYYYKDIKYIQYIPYKPFFKTNNYYIPYPLYNQEIEEKLLKGIVEPLFNEEDNKLLLYTLFKIDCKNILNIEINNKNFNYYLHDYFEMIKTPFNDFGILYNCPIKLKWILIENGMDINKFNNLKITFLNGYLDENTFEFKEHELEMFKEDLEKIFISERMKEILTLKNKDLIF